MNKYKLQVIKTLGSCLVLCMPFLGMGQTNWIPQGSRQEQLLDRLDIKLSAEPGLRFNTIKPFSGKRWAAFLQQLQLAGGETGTWNSETLQKNELLQDIAPFEGIAPKRALSSIDRHNINSALMQNSEWLQEVSAAFLAKKPILKTFYTQKANFFEVKEKDFFLAVNPILQLTWMKQSDNDASLFLNTRGITLRGMIAEKISFYTYLTENQERGPDWMMAGVKRNRAVPGAGFYKTFKKTAVDYFDARGAISFSATKFIDLQFGYDKQFIGNGYRSLFLSDNANSQLFFKINTRIWKLNYQNLFMELTPQYSSNPKDELLSKKYAAMHHLSIQATKWLNVGLFESTVFGRKDHFDFTYLNPVIFLRSVEQQNGSPDNGMAGIDFKANIAGSFQLYGQLALDELKMKEFLGNKGWWGNKWGIQLGGKYIDVLGVDNLDLQLEANIVRPFMYSFRDSVASYNHYNQPLAHPLGANFKEIIAIARYQPAKRWQVDARVIYALTGLDPAGTNHGNDIFKLYGTRTRDYGNHFGDAVEGKLLNASVGVSYEPRENLFLEAGITHRVVNDATIQYMAPGMQKSSSVIHLGLRFNMFQRKYDY